MFLAAPQHFLPALDFAHRGRLGPTRVRAPGESTRRWYSENEKEKWASGGDR